MRIYTRTGDRGETALFGGGRVPKDHPRVRAYGTVDELNSLLGRAVGVVRAARVRERLALLQHDLFAVGAFLATPPAAAGRGRPKIPSFPEGRIAEMEAWMDEAEEVLPSLDAFILPGGSPGAAELHVCRTVCRRAEREVVVLARAETEARGAAGAGEEGAGRNVEEAVRYLNRLSDLLFVMARLENREAGADDVRWRKENGEARHE